MNVRDRLLTKAKEAKEKPKLQPVTFCGEDLFVRKLSGKERDDYESGMVRLRGKSREVNLANLAARLTVLALANADGTRVFVDADVDTVGDMYGDDLDAVYSAATAFNGLSKEAVEEIAKN